MNLKFYARKDLLVNEFPGKPVRQGQLPRRINRKRDKATGGWPAQPEPFVCADDSKTGRHILREFNLPNADWKKDPPLWAADKATASACGIPFVDVQLTDGEWVPKPSEWVSKPKPTSKPKKQEID